MVWMKICRLSQILNCLPPPVLPIHEGRAKWKNERLALLGPNLSMRWRFFDRESPDFRNMKVSCLELHAKQVSFARQKGYSRPSRKPARYISKSLHFALSPNQFCANLWARGLGIEIGACRIAFGSPARNPQEIVVRDNGAGRGMFRASRKGSEGRFSVSEELRKILNTLSSPWTRSLDVWKALEKELTPLQRFARPFSFKTDASGAIFALQILANDEAMHWGTSHFLRCQ